MRWWYTGASTGTWRVAAQRMTVAVAIEDGALDRLTEVLEACRARGFDFERELAAIGVLLGSVHPMNLEWLRTTPGVAAVEPQQQVAAHELAVERG